jgi:predicted phosphodiesterase
MTNSKTSDAQIKIGIFADAQYCDDETAINRYYRNSTIKLADCITFFNQTENIDFVVGLGDLIDKDFSSFSKINTILETSEKEVFQVIGNHDLSVNKEYIDKVPEQLNLKKTYYAFNKNDWQFIYLDGNDLTFQSTNPEIVVKAEKIVKQLTEENKPNAHNWNGGIGEKQINWLKEQLSEAEKNKRKVILFCHYPLLPFEAHVLWNSEDVLAIINKHKCVKAWINGHNHAGNYAFQNGTHFITMKGMVDSESENAYSIVTLSDEKIQIEGFGREISRSLPID